MLKTKLGVSIALVGAAMYFLGVISFVPAVLLAGYVLIAEENAWVKRQAAKAIGVVIFFGLITLCIGWIDDVCYIINIIIHWFDKTAKYFEVPANITTFFKDIVYLVRDVVLVVLGFMAVKMKGFRIPVVDSLLDKFMAN